MLLFAAALILAEPADRFQVLGGAAFEELAARTDLRCPLRHVRDIKPADLDRVQEDFKGTLTARELKRLDAANPAERRCAGRNGLSCSTTATLEAVRKVRLMRRFAAYVCAT